MRALIHTLHLAGCPYRLTDIVKTCKCDQLEIRAGMGEYDWDQPQYSPELNIEY